MIGLARIRREIGRSLSRFRNLGPAEALGLYARALWLHLPFARPQPRPRPAERAERIVVTLTTIPARAGLLAPALRSLLDQDEPADRILLCLPHQSQRSGLAYPDPATLGLPSGVEVLRCQDQGPATKLLPSLLAEPEALLVVVDDDVIYPRDFLSTLLRAHRQRPAAALGFRGVRLRPGTRFADLWHVLASGIAADQTVDILFGTWGYLLPARLTDAAIHDFTGYPERLRWVDDVWISGHLARLGVPRLVVSARSMPVETLASGRAALTHGPNRSGENDETAIAAFAGYW